MFTWCTKFCGVVRRSWPLDRQLTTADVWRQLISIYLEGPPDHCILYCYLHPACAWHYDACQEAACPWARRQQSCFVLDCLFGFCLHCLSAYWRQIAEVTNGQILKIRTTGYQKDTSKIRLPLKIRRTRWTDVNATQLRLVAILPDQRCWIS